MNQGDPPPGDTPPPEPDIPLPASTASDSEEACWPRFLAMEDLGRGLRFIVLEADGSTREVMVWKRFKLHQPDVYDQALLAQVVQRNFDLSRSRSLLFMLGGGIGDFVFAIQAAVALRRFLGSSSSAAFEYIGVMNDDLLAIVQRFLGAVPVFDRFLSRNVPELATRFEPLLLDSTPHLFRAGDLTVGNVWDHLWWKWGIPGRFPGQGAVPVDAVKAGAAREIADLRQQRPGFPQPGQYVVLADDATMLRDKKAWPTAHWNSLVEWLLRETDLHVVLMMSREHAGALPAGSRLFVYDFRELGSQQVEVDLLRLCSLIEGARAVVSVDSGVAHVAALLDKPCVTLWGPTRPVTHAQPRNINLRLSSCPPCCADSFRQAVCARNICMEEIPATAVINVLGDLLHRPEETRQRFGCH